MMKNLLTFTFVMLMAVSLFSQELDADDRVNITQSTKPFIGVYAFGYQGLPTPGYPQFQLNNYGGVPGTIAATADNSILGMFAFSGHNGSAKKTVGIIRVKSMDNFASALSSRMDFLIGPNREQRMTILGDSGDVGIGTETPSRSLEVHRTGTNAAIEVSTDNANAGNAQIFLRTNETGSDEAHLRKWGSAAGGTVTTSSISAANLTVLRTGTGAGPLMMGTVGSNPLYLISNDAVGLYMDTSQEIGLGTLNPTEKLDVNGQIRMRNGAAAGYIPVSDANGVMTWTDPSVLGASSLWLESGNNVYHETGNVGIGGAPNAKLHIRADGTTLNDGIRITSSVNTAEDWYTYLSPTDDLTFRDDAVDVMTLQNSTGNIGIGTITPQHQLDIYKAGNTTVGITAAAVSNTGVAELRFRTGTTANDELFIKKYGSGAGGSFNNGLPLANMSVIASGTASGPLYTGTIGTHPVYLASNNEVAIFLDTDQDVGVNTQSPGAQMHVLETEGTNTTVLFGQSTYSGNSDRYAVQGTSVNNPGYGYGGYFEGGYRGVYARANSTTYTGTTTGVHGYASGTAGVRRGVYGQSNNPGGTTGYGVYGVATGASTNYGVYGQASGGTTDWAGYFNGNTFVDDTLVVEDRVHINSDESRNERLVVMETSGGDAVYIKNSGVSTTNVGGYGVEIDAGYRGIDIDMNDNDRNGSHYGYFISNLTGGGELTGYQYGMYTYTSGARTAGGGNYSLYAQQGGTSGSGTNWAGYFAGDVRITGTLDNVSDARLKKDVENVEGALDIIKQLQPKTYEFKADQYPHMALDTRPQIGFIAQDMEKVLPQLVRTAVHPEFVNDEGEDSDIPNSPAVDVKSINYIGIIPVLTQGIKELTTEVEEKDEAIEDLTNQVALLEDKIAKIENVDALLAQISAVEDKLENLDAMTIRMEQLEKDLQSCCLSSNAEPKADGGITTIELNGNQDTPQLAQNAPNPFNAETSINYYVPASAGKALLTITDMRGAILKSVNLETAGFGTVIVKAGELAPGTYTYTLSVDDRQVETKQMVLIK